MTAHALMQVDKSTFFRFLEKADERHRYEFVRGWIMQQQAGGTRKHARIASRFLSILAAQLETASFGVYGSDLAIDTGESIRYADVVVERLTGGADDSFVIDAPIMLVEVLSPTSEERDLSVKAVEYTSLASLQAYIVASQDEPVCYVWRRNESGTFSTTPETVGGLDASISLMTPAVEIRLRDIYEAASSAPPKKD